jgi:hypothetical protein
MSIAIAAFGVAFIVAVAFSLGGKSSAAFRRRVAAAVVAIVMASTALVLSIVDTYLFGIACYSLSTSLAVFNLLTVRRTRALGRELAKYLPEYR